MRRSKVRMRRTKVKTRRRQVIYREAQEGSDGDAHCGGNVWR